MEAVCADADGARGHAACTVRALSGTLHALHLYCGSLSAALICCCAPRALHWDGRSWRGQNVRGVACVILLVAWLLDAASAALRPSDVVELVSAVLAPLAWLAAAALHITLWSRRSAAPLLYLAIYWLLAAVSSAAIICQHLMTEAKADHIQLYIQGSSLIATLLMFSVDSACFYDEVTKRFSGRIKRSIEIQSKPYKYNETHFFSKISFFWLNSLLYKGYESQIEESDMGELPQCEQPEKYYQKFNVISKNQNNKHESDKTINMWQCYLRMVWPNFYIAGLMKLFSDMIGVVPPLGLAVIIQFIDKPNEKYDNMSHVTIAEYISNGYVMLLIVTISLAAQAFLSQNSTHLVTVEGTRLKIALQSMIYEKCMRLASWSSEQISEEDDSPLLQTSKQNIDSRSGLLTNLVSQDTYNIMSCVWICHYIWAIPLKVGFILYLLYTKLGISAIIGSAASILIVTPLQFYIGKKISDNSKHISKCTDHRISKMTEILQGLNVIKLYVWEDLFNEKILNLREVELKLLNKDSLYWSFLTFLTQVSTLLVTMITFTIYYYLENISNLTAATVFAGLALFNQLSVPLLILPVTVLMVIQAMVSTNRIKDFLELPESNNIRDEFDDQNHRKSSIGSNRQNEVFTEMQTDNYERTTKEDTDDQEVIDRFSDDEIFPLPEEKQEYIVRFRNAAYSWGNKDDVSLEVDDLDIPAGKLIIVVGSTGSGKSSLLSAILGEMYLDRGDVQWNSEYSMWYAGQPPWLLEDSVRENIVMDNPWCQSRYSRVVRAAGLRPDLDILPEGDSTQLARGGAPLSGGQRVRVSVARALYAPAQVVVLDEPLAALDAALAKHLVTRALLPATRRGRTLILATNRLELLHYADMVIVMEDGRVVEAGRGCGAGDTGAVSRWLQRAGAARQYAVRGALGPPGGSARERSRLSRALSCKSHHRLDDLTTLGIREATGSHLLAEVPTRATGSWRRPTRRPRPLLRQLSSPPPAVHKHKLRVDVRRSVSADESSAAMRARLIQVPSEQTFQPPLRARTANRPYRTLTRWTPRTLRRLLSTDSDTTADDSQEKIDESTCDTSLSMIPNGAESVAITTKPVEKTKGEDNVSELAIWWEWVRACGWWGVMFWACGACAQTLAVAADVWLAHVANTVTYSHTLPDVDANSDEQQWSSVRIYWLWCLCVVVAAGGAQASSAAGGAAARRALHERLLHAALHAPGTQHAASAPTLGENLHRFSADVLVVDKKLPIAVSRWAQLVLLCVAAVLVNVVAAPWTLVAVLPALFFYMALQSIYLRNARELQHMEAMSAGACVSLVRQTCVGAESVRAGRLQRRMRVAFQRRLATNHNALLLLNSANRWLGLSLDLVGAGSVVLSLGVALSGRSGGGSATAGLTGAYALLLPAYLAHLAKCRADLDQQLAAVERISADTHLPCEDYREDCSIPSGWQRDGKIQFDNVTVQYDPGSTPILNDISLSISPGEKVAICGRSGSGKSTLLLSCVGGTTLTRGRILIDGHNLTQVPLRALRHRVILLPQEAILFSGTLRENLDPLAVHTDEEIWHSLKAVGLLEFVSAQPAGLECAVGSGAGGGGWSAGRAARACCARAALHARLASALLLDEPAAALDAYAERTLLAAMAAVAPKTTILTVAHRICSVRDYDRAVVVEDGRIAEQGPVERLLAQPNSRLSRMLALAQAKRHM